MRGLVAYGLYKIAKREWTDEFYKANGAPPDRTDVIRYTKTWTPAMIAGKQAEADDILRDYGQQVVAGAKPDIVETALRGTTLRAIGVNVASAFVYTLILIGIVAVLHYAGVGLPSWTK